MKHSLTVISAFVASAFGGAAEPTADQVAFFESKIRPVLADKCYQCHSKRSPRIKGGLALDTAQGVEHGGESGAVLVPGDVEKSLLIQSIRYDDPDIAMPPKNKGGKLDDSVIADFEKWVKMGAPDPRSGASIKPQKTVSEQAKKWWSFQPVRKPAIPVTKNASWPRSEIDRFILAALEAKGLRPAGDADRYTLLRRLSLALTGLPPEPGLIATFATSSDPVGIDRVIDDLLATRQFGQHWARQWLDVARYAESSGRDVNGIYPEAWRYRDYVVDSFNQDTPFDRFIREQIAGDLLPDKNDDERARNLIATGFLALGPKSLNEAKPRQLAVDIADEQIDTTTKAFLGLTIGCARCHDHKTDPFSQQDYTALAGIFLSTDTRYGAPGGPQARNAAALIEVPSTVKLPLLSRRIDPATYAKKNEELEELMSLLFDVLSTNGGPPGREFKASNGMQFDELVMRTKLLEVDVKAFNPDGTLKLRIMGALDKPSAEDVRNGVRIHRNGPSNGFDVIDDCPLFGRGSIEKEGGKIARGIPEFLSGGQSYAIGENESGRLQLANWISSPSNPLTARVLVNRVWHWLFGRGLVSTVDDFGKTGAQPSHPELLDYLAVRLVDHKWSVKKLIKEIMLSRVYQLSGTDGPASGGDADPLVVDPDNILLRRASKQSLTAEELRDSMLAANGALDPKPQTGTLLSMTGHGSITGPRYPVLKPDVIVGAGGDFRSIYLPIARDIVPESLSVFNFADTSAMVGVRESTIVPSQALYLMNSGFVEQQSARLADRICQTSHTVEGRFAAACLRIYCRPPLPAETQAAKEFISRQPPDQARSAWTSVCRALFASAEFRFP